MKTVQLVNLLLYFAPFSQIKTYINGFYLFIYLFNMKIIHEYTTKIIHEYTITALVHLPPPPVCRPTFLSQSTTYLTGCDLTLRKLRWCGVRWLVGSHNFLAAPSRSVVLPLNRSALSVTWASTSTATLAPPPTCEELCHAASLHYDSFVIYVAMLPTTASALSWSRSSTPGSTTATLCLSDFWPISNDASRPYSTLQLAWCSDFVAMTTWPMPSWYCTGCVCRNGSTSSLRSWHTEYWTVWHHRTRINLFRYQACQVVAVCGRHSHRSYSSRRTVCQHSAIPRFLSLPLSSGTLCLMTCNLHHLFLPFGSS